jgi:hypothetical protein
MSNKIQKRLVTFEVISKGDKPIDLSDLAQNHLISAVHNVISDKVSLRYHDESGVMRELEFCGVAISEIR